MMVPLLVGASVELSASEPVGLKAAMKDSYWET